MPENYDHYITKNIKALYKRRLFSPIVYLIHRDRTMACIFTDGSFISGAADG
mgnify:CR=1 FL=1